MKAVLACLLSAVALCIAPALASAAPVPVETAGITALSECGDYEVTIDVNGRQVYEATLPDPIGYPDDCGEPTATVAHFLTGNYGDVVVSFSRYFPDFNSEIAGWYALDIHRGATGSWTMSPVEEFGLPGSTVERLQSSRSVILTRDQLVNIADGPNGTVLPLEVFIAQDDGFLNVTRSFPSLLAADAATWQATLATYPGSSGLRDAMPVIAWAGDEDQLGHRRYADSVITQLAADPGLFSSIGPTSAATIEAVLSNAGY